MAPIKLRKKKVQLPQKPRQKATRPQTSQVPKARFSLAAMDEAGRAYAAMLTDPCNAELAKPLYMGTGSGYLTRVVSDSNYTTDSGFHAIVPGVPAQAINYGTAASSVASLTTVAVQGPGYAFLNGVAYEARPVAACLTFIYTGSELNRSGLVNAGQFTAYDLNAFSSVPADNIASSFVQETRMTSNKIEVKWAPGQLDQDFGAVNNTTYLVANRSAIAVLWRGLNGTAKVRSTIIYEWRPTLSEGVAAPPSTGNASRNTTEQIVGLISQAEPKWAYSGFADAAMGALGILAPAAADYFVPGSGGLLRGLFK